MYNLATLRYGDKGPLTELLQLALTRAGFSPGNIDGIFGSKTLDAVKSFQASAGLTRDGIVGKNTWRLLIPYLRGYAVHTIKPRDTLYSIANSYKTTIRAIETANPGINPMNLQVGSRIIVPYSFKVVPSNVQFTSLLMDFIADGLTARYPFIKSRSIGNSKIGRALYCFSIGTGTDQVFYNGAHHANEWITATLLATYLENYSISYVTDALIGSESARELFKSVTLYVMPLVNPDGVDLVTGYLNSGSYYEKAKKIAADYPGISFPSGWKANIAGTDLNLQYPAGWEEAREIKFSQGYVSPAPRDYVGSAPLSAPESKAVYDFTLRHNFALTLSYHTQGQVIYWKYLNYTPPYAETIGTALAAASGYLLDSTPYESGHAGYKDWFILNYFRPSYTIEAGLGVSPLPLSQFPEIYKDNEKLLSIAQTFANL